MPTAYKVIRSWHLGLYSANLNQGEWGLIYQGIRRSTERKTYSIASRRIPQIGTLSIKYYLVSTIQYVITEY